MIFAFILNFSVVNAQRNYQAFDILNDSIIVPPNGILIGANLFMDDSEVMNCHYLEYLHFLAQDSADQVLINAYPDTNIFETRHLKHLLRQKGVYYKRKGGKHVPMRLLLHDDKVHEPEMTHHWWNYFSYHGTKHHPVVGISYEQAVAYCKWRSVFVTRLFNESLKQKNKYSSFENKKVAFQFSLPDEKMWQTAIQNQYEKSLKDTLIIIHNKCTRSNFKNEPLSAFSNTPNALEFYNLIGNVAEMMAEKGKCKGGSYVHSFSESDPKTTIMYSKPERWLGFRCACLVIVQENTK